MTWFQKPPLGTPLDWGNPLNDGTVLHLAMNEGHGDKVQDLSLSGNHGTLNNFAFPPTAASGWNPGQTGVGLNFDSVGSNYVDCGDVGLSGRNLTISFSVKQSSGCASWVNILSFGNLKFRFETAGTPTDWKLYNSGIDAASIDIPAAVVVDEWRNITFTSDVTNWNVYFDGVEYVSGTVDGDINSSNKLCFGSESGVDKYYKGAIDQPRIQSRAWSAKEVKDYAINPWQVYLDDGGI